MQTYERGKATKLTNYFITTEFDCKCGKCETTYIDEKLVVFLQQIREKFGKPVRINSGYRCSAHNRAVGGATGSRHTKGQAADISVSGVEPKEVAKFAESIGVKGIGLYSSNSDGYFCHIDTRENKFFWLGHRQEQVFTFGGATTNQELTSKEQSLVKEWQLAAIADGYKLPSGADGIWGPECEAVAKKAVVKKRSTYTNKNLTKIVQRALGVSVDGLCGSITTNAIKKYQKEKGLAADGAVGIKTWKRLLG